ncbi:MAG: sialate O-acetylesterase, partial [Saprospiraceae bacterium]|nr:sialate O-acetylesterase [Saprospiraceae bacterium]
MKYLNSFLIFLSLFFWVGSGKAEIKLPAIFDDHMVLQQETEAPIWGMAAEGKKVTLMTSWDKKSYTAKADDEGHWKIKVSTPQAGGPYEISISDGKELILKDILIGEVWVCSGQSNMQMPMKGYFNQPILGSNEAVATSANPRIRLFTVERDKSLTTKSDFTGDWLNCSPENVIDFSAAAYFFGRMINQALDVPVGLICSSWGGTRIEPWISEAGLKEFDWVNLPDKKMTDEYNQQTPTVLYNAMIAPMVGYGIRGALWYQGESNRNEPMEYEKLMAGLIQNWRSEWDQGDFSFYYCQIAPFDYGPKGLNSAYLREAQLKASMAVPNAGMASLMDGGEKDNIHPADKEAAGERMAYWALAKTYGQEGIEYSGPVFKEMTIEGPVVNLTFDHAQNGLTTFGKPLTGFQVAGENKRFYPAQGFITRQGIT